MKDSGGVAPADIEALRRCTWAQLDRKAIDAGVPLGRIKQARTRDELRLLILKARAEADG